MIGGSYRGGLCEIANDGRPCKGTLARRLAAHGLHHLDTGLLYRARWA